LKIYMHTN